MDKIVNNSNKPVANQEHKILFRNTFYSYLNNYGSYIFSLVTSFMLARLISQDLWGYLILAFSYMTIISLIISFLPPGLDYSLRYYLSIYGAQNEKYKMKSIIKHGINQRLLSSLPIFFLSILFFIYFSSFLEINLKNYIHLLYILSPLIFVNSLNSIFTSINQAFNKFKFTFFLLILRYTINIGGLISLIIFFEIATIEYIAFIDLFSFLIPFLVNLCFNLINYKKIKKPEKDELTFKETLSKTLSYGSYISFGAILNQTWNELSLQFIGIFESAKWVTGYNIANNYIAVPRFTVTSSADPLTVSFSRFYSTEDYLNVNKIFILTFHYTTFLFSLFTGLFYFFSKLFLAFIYGSSYLDYSFIIELMLISSIFGVLVAQFDSLLFASKNVKLSFKFVLIILSLKIPLFLIGLFFYGILGALIGLLIIYIIGFILRVIICLNVFRIKLDIKRILKQYIAFFLSIGIVISLNYFILDEINNFLLTNLNLTILKYLNFISIILFCMIFIILNLLFKIFSKKDIENLEAIFEKDTKIFNIIKRFLKLFKRFLN